MFKKLLFIALLIASFQSYAALTFSTIISATGISSTNSLPVAQANRVAIQNAVNSCTDTVNGCTVQIIEKDAYVAVAKQMYPNGTLNPDGTPKTDPSDCNDSSLRGISVPSNVRVALSRTTLKAFPNRCQSYSMFRFWTVHDSELVMDRTAKIIGDKLYHTYTNDGQPCSVAGITHECGNLVSITNSQRIVVSYGTIGYATGDGVYVGGNSATTDDIRIYYVNIDNNRRQAISVISGNNIVIEKNNLTNTGGNGTPSQYIPPGLGLDIEVDNCAQRVTNLIVRNNYTGGNYGGGVKAYAPICANDRNITTDDVYQNVTIEDNTINEYTKPLAFSNAMNIVAKRNNIKTSTGDAIVLVGAKDIIAKHNTATKIGAMSGYFISATSTPTRQNIGNIITENLILNFGTGLIVWPSNTPLTEVDSIGNHPH